MKARREKNGYIGGPEVSIKYLVILNRRSTFVPQMTDINDKTKYNEDQSLFSQL